MGFSATSPHNRRSTPRRYGLREMNCWIKIPLPSRRECTPIKIAPVRAFAAVSLLEYGGLNPILPFLGGRSDAACRVAILSVPHCYPPPRRSPLIIARRPHGANGWWRYACNGIPAMPTLVAGSSQREDSPAHPQPACPQEDGSATAHKKAGGISRYRLPRTMGWGEFEGCL